MNHQTSEYTISPILGLHPGIFGESYAITTATEIAANKYGIECFILTQRPKESLLVRSFDIDVSGIPAELETFDLAFATREALTQSKIEIGNLLETRASELTRPDLAYLNFELSGSKGSIVGPWVRGRFSSQIRQISGITQCPRLKFYLSLLFQNAPMSPSAA